MYPILQYRHERSEAINSALWFNRITPPGSVIMTGDEGSFIANYSNRKIMNRPACWAGCAQEQLEQIKTTVEGLMAQGVPVYITSMGLEADDPDGTFQGFISRNFDLSAVGKCWTEDWHQDCMVLRLGWVKLYRFKLKAR